MKGRDCPVTRPLASPQVRRRLLLTSVGAENVRSPSPPKSGHPSGPWNGLRVMPGWGSCIHILCTHSVPMSLGRLWCGLGGGGKRLGWLGRGKVVVCS